MPCARSREKLSFSFFFDFREGSFLWPVFPDCVFFELLPLSKIYANGRRMSTTSTVIIRSSLKSDERSSDVEVGDSTHRNERRFVSNYSRKYVLIGSLIFIAAVATVLAVTIEVLPSNLASSLCVKRKCAYEACFCTTQEWEFDKYNGFSSIQYEKAKEEINNPIYVDDLIGAVGQPPATGSQTMLDEIEYLHQLESNRTNDDNLLIEDQVWRINIVKSIIGPFKEDQDLYKLAYDASLTEAMVTPLFISKLHFDRVRPSFYDTSLQPSIEVPPHPAYPSGHATQATTVALILSCQDPDNREFYINNAARVGWNRELAGVHYPSDTAAGVRLAQHVFLDVAREVGLLNAAKCSVEI